MHISHGLHEPSANPANWRAICQLEHLPTLIGDQP